MSTLTKGAATSLFLLALLGVSGVNALIPEPPLSLPTLPQQYLETQFEKINQGFQERAALFLKGRPFQRWEMNKSRKNILVEFQQLNDWRYRAWYVDPNAKTLISRMDFMVAQDLLEKGLYKKPGFLAFNYNQTNAYYNASTLVLNGCKFLALESPNARTLKSFFLLLLNHRVTRVVQLTTANEYESGINSAYWQGKLKTQGEQTLLQVPQSYNPNPYAIPYYMTDAWAENQGIHPATLLKLIQKVRKNATAQDLIACHSTHGNGRTGTFIAGFLLLNEIDRQIANGATKSTLDISIEKIVMQLSLQRPYLVRQSEQYVTLYRLVDLYISHQLN